ncbi:class I SAM-dependent methyltransferase [Microbacterium sp. WHRI 7836]|uniref:class I SAM-dependent methyltransferase n=1 Tax=Microbacterium TaxID=33882 RepID=UPI0032EB4CF4
MYDEAYASVYDTIFPPDAAVVHGVVQTLTAFAAAPGAAILEYGAGTGRIAIPMSDSFAVTAVEPSPHMRDRLVQKRSRTGGPTVVAGDMLTRLEIGPQALVYCVLGTFACITDHDEQERALQKMSAHVEPGGRLVVESFNPRALADHLGSEPIKIAQALDEDGTLLNSTYRRGEDGKLVAEHSWTAPGKPDVYFSEEVLPVSAEQVAQWAGNAGLELEHCWGDWDRTPHDAIRDGLYVLVLRRPE